MLFPFLESTYVEYTFKSVPQGHSFLYQQGYNFEILIDLLPHPAELRLFLSSIVRVVLLKMFYLSGHVDQNNVPNIFFFL